MFLVAAPVHAKRLAETQFDLPRRIKLAEILEHPAILPRIRNQRERHERHVRPLRQFDADGIEFRRIEMQRARRLRKNNQRNARLQAF